MHTESWLDFEFHIAETVDESAIKVDRDDRGLGESDGGGCDRAGLSNSTPESWNLLIARGVEIF